MLRFDRVAKSWANGRPALDNVSLEIGAGEITAVLGGSGAGKSTLLRLAAGLEAPSAGVVLLDGAPIRGPSPAIGVVFQEPRLMPWLTVAENVGFGLAHVPAAERARRVAATLARVGLAGQGRALPRELSGGMAQRAALARALVARPRVLLLDEPFSALDAPLRLDLQRHLLELWAQDRPTLLLVTHDIDEALTLADRIVLIEGPPGRVRREFAVVVPRPRRRHDRRLAPLKDAILDAFGLGAAA
jgi:sulfonate transport system ATP-binding protein